MSTYNDASLIYYPSGYKAGKAYSLKPTDGSGDLTFTRASSATRVNAEGLIEEVAANVPRIDYTSGCGKLLLEPQRANILKYSNTFTNSAWVKLNCSVASNSIISPDGTQNSTTLTSSTTNNFLYNALETANGLYTLSFFVKYLDTDTVNVSMTDFATGDAIAKFNFSTGLFNTPIVTGSFTNTTTNVITLDNGWFKISLTSQKNAGTILSSRIDGLAVGKSVYVYAAQNELGSYPTSYIPTTTTAVTRVADASSIVNGALFSTSGAVYCNVFFTQQVGIGQPNWFSLIDGSNNLTFYDRAFFNSIGGFVNVGSIGDINTWQKIAFKWDGANIKLFRNGVLINSVTQSAAFNPNTLNLGRAGGSIISSIKYDGIIAFPTAPSDAELLALTTI